MFLSRVCFQPPGTVAQACGPRQRTDRSRRGYTYSSARASASALSSPPSNRPTGEPAWGASSCRNPAHGHPTPKHCCTCDAIRYSKHALECQAHEHRMRASGTAPTRTSCRCPGATQGLPPGRMDVLGRWSLHVTQRAAPLATPCAAPPRTASGRREEGHRQACTARSGRKGLHGNELVKGQRVLVHEPEYQPQCVQQARRRPLATAS